MKIDIDIEYCRLQLTKRKNVVLVASEVGQQTVQSCYSRPLWICFLFRLLFVPLPTTASLTKKLHCTMERFKNKKTANWSEADHDHDDDDDGNCLWHLRWWCWKRCWSWWIGRGGGGSELSWHLFVFVLLHHSCSSCSCEWWQMMEIGATVMEIAIPSPPTAAVAALSTAASSLQLLLHHLIIVIIIV